MTDLPAHTLTTARLLLVPLSPPLVAALVAQEHDRAAALAPFRYDPCTFVADAFVLGLRHAQLQADPTEEPWLYRACVERATGDVVARGGFHARPDADGTVEVGYEVRADRRGEGLATELVRGLLGWGAEHGARRCLASVAPDNAASLAVVRRLGFVRVGEQWDERDGLELVHAVDLPLTAPGAAL